MLTHWHFLKRTIFALAVLWVCKATAQELPPISTYPPSVYGADNQNWQASQAEDHTLYFANNKGLLAYNGAQWQLNLSPNETIIRSVSVVNNRIYTGAHMDFGFWLKGQTGALQYTSLRDTLGIAMLEGEQIWKIIPYKEKILFQSLNGIYIYNPEAHTINYIQVSSKNAIFRLFVIDGGLYFQEEGKGLYTIKDGKASLYDDRKEFVTMTFVGLYKRDSYWLGISEKSGIYTISPTAISPWEHKGATALEGKTLYRAIDLANGSIGIGTIANGFIKLNPEGDLEYQLTQDKGLGNNTVLSMYEDRLSNIWMGLDNGIACINTSSPIRTYYDQEGRLGTTYTSAVFNEDLYLGTNQGLFYRAKDRKKFELVQGTQEQVWTLQNIQGDLICGHTNGTFKVSDGEATQIGGVEGTWGLRQVPNRPDLLVQGNYDGLYVLSKKQGVWSVRNKLEGFNISSRYFEFSNDHKILVSNEYKGVYEIEVDTAFAKAKTYALNPSVTKGEHSSLVKFEGEIYYAHKSGIYRYVPETSRFQMDEKMSAVYKDNFVSAKLVNDRAGKLWAFTKKGVVFFSRDALETELAIGEIAIPQRLRNAAKGFENIEALSSGAYLLGTTNGFLNITAFIDDADYKVTINQIELKERNGNAQLVPLGTQGDFKSIQNNVYFMYNVAQYDKFKQTDYQYRLKGFYDIWSEWSTESSQEFANIPPGDYTFEVRARVGNTFTKNSAVYSFSIGKPWYISYIAIACYIVIGLLIFTMIQVYNKRRYKNRQDLLLEKKKRDLDLKALAIEKENVELRNQNLRSDIQARNRELATSTLAMVNKSKTLKAIKEKLVKLESSKQLDQILKDIDQNININEDWSFFEKAFNHADKDFFKKVKEVHPELTTNDLKLCVYLRLNLSSKEIAPLLNISHRSVEIKRYRLRKKINLERSVQLNEYFINL